MSRGKKNHFYLNDPPLLQLMALPTLEVDCPLVSSQPAQVHKGEETSLAVAEGGVSKSALLGDLNKQKDYCSVVGTAPLQGIIL